MFIIKEDTNSSKYSAKVRLWLNTLSSKKRTVWPAWSKSIPFLMMKKKIHTLKQWGFTVLSIAFCVACSPDEVNYVDRPFDLEIPSNFPPVAQDLSGNYPTVVGVKLGRRLFYDPQLSRNNTISCSHCHQQAYAFTHHGHTFSHGIDNQFGTRNAPAVQNMIFHPHYFYDGASSSLRMLSIVPIHSPLEMDSNLQEIASKLKKDPSYVQLFNVAFDGEGISSGNILDALAQFMAVMISADSRYDKYVREEKGGTLSDLEKEGLVLFEQKCSTCHATDLFTDNRFRNNGLAINPRLNDRGLAQVTGFDTDRYKFKVPSLRNAELTAPYMHDGRFNSLKAVLDFYDNGVQQTPNLDPVLQQNGYLGIPLTEEAKKAIIAFIKTLTDEAFITNPLFYYQT